MNLLLLKYRLRTLFAILPGLMMHNIQNPPSEATTITMIARMGMGIFN
jgi:hypothetical protein